MVSVIRTAVITVVAAIFLIALPRPAAAQGSTPAALDGATIDRICQFAGTNKSTCEACFQKNPPETWTAIGCVPTTPDGLIRTFLGFGAGIAGGIAFLLILFGGLQIMTSAGNPEQLNGGKDLVTAAITGLLLIIFSVFILRLIGYDILRIPGFG
jgi:hypothetical protein